MAPLKTPTSFKMLKVDSLTPSVQDVVVKVSASGYAPQRGSTYVITCTAEGGKEKFTSFHLFPQRKVKSIYPHLWKVVNVPPAPFSTD